jgi:phosphogluconate dehydratase
VNGTGLAAYASEPVLGDGALTWRAPPPDSLDKAILRPVADAFQPTGGLALVTGNLGRAVIKTSAVAADRTAITAPARVFHTQEAVTRAFKAGELTKDVVVVLTEQGPRANGMPELHGLMPSLSVLQARGLKVALLTDGRLSGASGKILSALHVTPEAVGGGPIARLRDGDLVTIDAAAGVMRAHLDDVELMGRTPHLSNDRDSEAGLGRELFAQFRRQVRPADEGADALWA